MRRTVRQRRLDRWAVGCMIVAILSMIVMLYVSALTPAGLLVLGAVFIAAVAGGTFCVFRSLDGK